LGTESVPCIGELITNRFPLYTEETNFYTDLKKKVEQYFKDKKIENPRNISKFVLFNTIFIFTLMPLFYYLSMYTKLPFLYKFIFAVLGGTFHHLSMVHLFHDISHFCYSNNPLVWRYMGYLSDLFTGHSMYIWIHRHCIAHHVYTNVVGVDPDIGIYKCSPGKPLEGLSYRTKVAIVPTWFQPYLYFFVVMQMQLDDFFSYSRNSMENTKINDTGIIQSLLFYGLKLIFLTHRLFLPLYLGFPIFQTIVLFLVAELAAGVLFGYFSQITHVQPDVCWPSESPIRRDWGELQVETAADFGHDSFLWTYLSGYLNYQYLFKINNRVVHHLLPSVAPHYYRELLPLIKELCNEYKLKYIIHDDFWSCTNSHLEHLKPFQSYRKRFYEKVQNSEVKEVHIIDRIDSFIRGLLKSN
jgi:acyl-lipid (8-3)-desaturase